MPNILIILPFSVFLTLAAFIVPVPSSTFGDITLVALSQLQWKHQRNQQMLHSQGLFVCLLNVYQVTLCVSTHVSVHMFSPSICVTSSLKCASEAWRKTPGSLPLHGLLAPLECPFQDSSTWFVLCVIPVANA